MSVGQYVVFTVYKQEFAVPIYEIKEVINYVKATKLPSVEDYFKGIINLRGELISVMDLALKLCIINKEIDSKHILIVETEERRTGAIVDEVKEIIELSEENIKELPYEVIYKKYIMGMGKLDNRLLVVISLKTLLEE